jgi:osmotically-inducible protein OsmY
MKKIAFLCLALALQGCAGLNQQDPRTAKLQWQDKSLSMDINGLTSHGPFKDKMNINSIAVNGEVLLIGQSTSPQLTEQFLGLVKQIPNVKKVFNEIESRPLLDLGQISQDTLLTTRVKAEMIASKRLSDVTVKVLTENGVVYLLGYVNQTQADAATHIARNVSGVKKVVRFLHIV